MQFTLLQGKDHQAQNVENREAAADSGKDVQHTRVRRYLGSYSTSANWWKWMKSLNFQKVENTQNVCKEMMEIMGYIAIQDTENKGPVDVITDFCPNRNITFC